jgi:two-component system nitrogen regulation sensor histidine kinase NtrY
VLQTYLDGQQERLGLAAITVFNRGGQPIVHARDATIGSAVPTKSVNKEQVRQGLAGQEVTTVHELDHGDMIQAIVPIKSSDRGVLGALVVGSYVTQRLESRLRGISQSFQEYKQLRLLKQPLKGIYILLFLLMTLVIVFSATWFGLYLARGITEPVQMLAEGTRAVAAGNLNYKVLVRADDEIGVLVDSFNRMTSDLAYSQTSSSTPTATSRPSTRRSSSGAAIPRRSSTPSPRACSRSTRPGASPPSTAPPNACWACWPRRPRTSRLRPCCGRRCTPSSRR